MDLFVEIVFVICTVILISVVLLQAGRGGGLGTALGGGASQGVFGGGGGADFLAKLTQGLAAAFMVCSVYLAYASTHTGSERLRKMSEDLESEKHLVGEDDQINYEAVGPNPLPLPAAEGELPVPTKTEEPQEPEALDPEALDPETLERMLGELEGGELELEGGAPEGGEPTPPTAPEGEPTPPTAPEEPAETPPVP